MPCFVIQFMQASENEVVPKCSYGPKVPFLWNRVQTLLSSVDVVLQSRWLMHICSGKLSLLPERPASSKHYLSRYCSAVCSRYGSTDVLTACWCCRWKPVRHHWLQPSCCRYVLTTPTTHDHSQPVVHTIMANEIAIHRKGILRGTERHLPYGITQSYLQAATWYR